MTSSSVETLINFEEISCEDFKEIVDIAASLVGVVTPVGWAAGFVWNTVGGLIIPECQPKSFPEELVKAIEAGQYELVMIAFNEAGHRAGLKNVVRSVGVAEAFANVLIGYLSNFR